VRKHAPEILKLLESEDQGWGEAERDLFEKYPEWVARVHEALADEEQPSPEEMALRAAVFHAYAEDERAVAQAFAGTLLEGLPAEFTKWDQWFESATRASEEEQKYLLSLPVVQEVRAQAKPLVAFGVTPLTVFYASEAIAQLADRLLGLGLGHVAGQPEHDPVRRLVTALVENRRRGLVPKVLITPGERPPEGPEPAIPARLLADEIERVADCGRAVAHGLLRWLVGAAQYKPLLFGGFEADPDRDAVALTRTADIETNLFKRWGLHRSRTADNKGRGAGAATASQRYVERK
jgi:hypothetical protein